MQSNFRQRVLEGRVALVTGGTRGIGLACARALLEHGAEVFVSGRTSASVEAAISLLDVAPFSGRVAGSVLDVRDNSQVEGFLDAGLTRFGRVDILVNSAGQGGGGNTIQLSHQHWLEVLDVNLTGTFRLTHALLRRGVLQQQRWGRIINIASTGGKQGVMYAAAYTASKHGVVGMTKALGLEFAKSGITINAVCPGFVETDLAVGARERLAAIQGETVMQVKQRIEARIPIGRYIVPAEVAHAVIFYATDISGAMTAQTVNVCGGLGNY